MAIIYSYPTKGSPAAAGDLLLISDSADSNKTKSITVQSIADFVDGEVTLQEVLNTSNTAYFSNTSIPPKVGTIILGTTNGAGAQQDTLTFSGQTGNITMVAGLGVTPSTANLTVGGSTTIGASPLVFNSAGTELTVGGGDFEINATGTNDLTMTSYIYTVDAGNNIQLNAVKGIGLTSASGGTGNISLNSNTANIESDCNDFTVDASNNIKLESSGSYIDLDTTGAIRIGLAPNRPSSIDLATDGNVTIFHSSGGHTTSNGKILLNDGSAASPQYTFNNDAETGMYLDAVDKLGFGAKGAEMLVLDGLQNLAEFKPLIRGENGISLKNSTLPVPDVEETMIRFAQGEFQAEFFDGPAAVPGLTYTGNSGTWQLINNRMTGSGRIYVTGGAVPFPSVNLAVGNFVINVGPPALIGLDLLTHFPPSPAKAPGNISISEATGFANNPLLVPVAGVSVAGAPSYFALKTYAALPADLQLINPNAPNWSNGIILTFDFSYNLDPA